LSPKSFLYVYDGDMQSKDKDALPAKGRKAQGKAVRSCRSRADYDTFFRLGGFGSDAMRALPAARRRFIAKGCDYSPADLTRAAAAALHERERGFRVPPANKREDRQPGYAIGSTLVSEQQHRTAAVVQLAAVLASSTSQTVKTLLRGQAPPHGDDLPAAAAGICLTPRLLAQVPAAALAGR
jgi:hypothetical protein